MQPLAPCSACAVGQPRDGCAQGRTQPSAYIRAARYKLVSCSRECTIIMVSVRPAVHGQQCPHQGPICKFSEACKQWHSPLAVKLRLEPCMHTEHTTVLKESRTAVQLCSDCLAHHLKGSRCWLLSVQQATAHYPLNSLAAIQDLSPDFVTKVCNQHNRLRVYEGMCCFSSDSPIACRAVVWSRCLTSTPIRRDRPDAV